MDTTAINLIWKSIDSLEKKGLLTDALTEVRKIKRAALEAGESGHLVKAITHENKYLIQLEEDSAIKALQRLESEMKSYPEPARSVMHSLAGQWYSAYLQGHLWQLRNRTEFVGEPGPDIRTWGIRHLVDRIQEHYAASLKWDGLRTASVEDYALLLTDQQNTDALRPTLYDILMHRAIDFYSGTESYLTQPVYQYVLTDPAAFSEARRFVSHSFPTIDSLANSWQALKWYQELLQFRLDDEAHEAALIDADLKRLRFVYDHIVLDNKDSLYIRSLDALKLSHADHPESSLVDYYRAEWLMQQASQWQAGEDNGHRYDYNKALEICREAIRKYPDAYGSKLCQNLISQIESKSVSSAIEALNLPGEELLAQIEYRNISSVQLKLVKLPESFRRWRGDNWNGEEILTRLNQLTSLRSWTQPLNDGGDHQVHRTEIAIPAQDLGHYALVISDRADFNVKSSTTGSMMFTVTELGYWYLDDKTSTHVAAIVNRKTGMPMEGVKVEFITYDYNSIRRRQEENKIGEALSDVNGWVTLPVNEKKNVALRLTKGNDELFEAEGYHLFRSSRDYTDSQSTLFFSDRAIYRPGQKIYFKGYILKFDKNRIPEIVPKKPVEITFYDANGQEIMRKNFVANEYGSISGHFDLPAGGLTGQMSLSSSHGSNRYFFQVEEYKRPKFEITYDTLKEIARLNEDVVIKGFAKNYAGNAVQGASVKYRVERIAYRPWWYGYYGKSIWPREEDRQLLAVGNTVTNPDGSFLISFLAKPKSGGDPNLMYRFEATAFVTDITGESHELTKTLLLNSQGFEVNINLPGKISMDFIDTVNVVAVNSDGATVSLNGTLSVLELKGPEQNKRSRLWASPDIFTITETEYRTRFPAYHVPFQENMSEWEISKRVGEQAYSVSGRTGISLTGLINKPGFYRLVWKWKDALGKELDIIQHVMIYDDTRLLPGHELIHIDIDDKKYQPGEKIEIDLLTGLNSAPKAIRLVERRSATMTRQWYSLPSYNDQSVTVSESDRGGLYVHHLAVFNNRFHQSKQLIQVPWTNKALQVELLTWRDKMEPGDEETWTMTVKGEKKDAVAAELLLSMYDASLDAFVPHQWQMELYPSTMSRIYIAGSLQDVAQYWGLTHHWEERYSDVPYRQYRDINTYGYYPEGGFGYYQRRYKGERDMAADGAVMLEMQSESAAPPVTVATTGNVVGDAQQSVESEPPKEVVPPSLRTALDETVFFFPHLTTDEKGNVSFSFRMKEGLTRWKFQALAHTKDLSFGLTQAEAVTQKQLMVFPNPPRFFREGDTIAFQIKTSNLMPVSLSGSTRLKIVDATNDEDVSAMWKISPAEQSITINAGASVATSWTLVVPDNWVKPVKYQVFASAGSVSDGEESMIPVVTNRMLITETLPLPLKANETRTFVFRSMLDNKSSSLDPHQYVIEMTSSPAWYAVQALPYLMEFPHECAEQIFNRLYANNLAAHITEKQPQIRKTYETWRATNNDALLSNLEKNQDLKSAMLEETPWVRDAMGETGQKKDIALLFETNRMRNESRQAISLLRQMQMPNGAWAWFPGGIDNWYITQYIIEGFGHMRKMGIDLKDDQIQGMIEQAVPYIDSRMIQWYDELKRLANSGNVKMEDHQIGSLQVHYIYARSFYPEINRSSKLDEVISYVESQSEKYWLQHGLYDQGMMALGFYRSSPDNHLSRDILASLRQKTIYHEELGRYWKFTPGFYWNEAPIEMQSLMIELYQTMKVPQPEIDELRVWLLKQKQTTRWKSTKATAAAVYALLIHPDAWLSSTGIVEVSLGGTKVFDQNTNAQAGSGYVKESWGGSEIKDSWSSIKVSNPNNHIAWGAAYWQYWEDIDKVKSTVEENPLRLSRALLITQTTDRGVVTTEPSGRQLKVGDKLVVRLIIETDRAMDFVHLKDLRASGFEPMDVISGYKWSGGVGYYQSTKDLATHFFIDHLPRGKYVIEYPVTVAQAGAYSGGLATLQCMYAPEFGDHSEGRRVAASGM
jgi:uncharacterized protein YfaS (alpha-2-macroglobulin family)